MNPPYEYLHGLTRRHFLRQCHVGLGGIALASLLGDRTLATGVGDNPASVPPKRTPHFRPRAKQVIFLHMAGGPSQLELFDHKPELTKRDGQNCPEE